jgi:hypothetical protein
MIGLYLFITLVVCGVVLFWIAFIGPNIRIKKSRLEPGYPSRDVGNEVVEGRWIGQRAYRVVGQDGTLWHGDLVGIDQAQSLCRPGDRVEQLHAQTNQQWREVH